MLQFEPIEVASHPASTPVKRPPLPIYVEPAAEEALVSWLLRLATRLGVSFHALAKQSFGIDDRFGHTRWWTRPHPWSLACISARTGVSVAQLRSMTFAGYEPTYRDDEAPARFAGRRYDSRAAERPSYRFAACGRCLEEDSRPYLRTSWLLGWMAVCPHHGSILIERCRACGASLRVAPFAMVASFSPNICTRCGCNLLDGRYHPAHPAAVRMQAAMFLGKHGGITELEGLGRFTWKELVALADVLIGMIWTDLTLAEQEEIFLLWLVRGICGREISPGRVFRVQQESVELAAGSVEGALLGFGDSRIDERSTVLFEGIGQHALYRAFAQGRLLMQLTDDLPAQSA